jgi:hypothetical protein
LDNLSFRYIVNGLGNLKQRVSKEEREILQEALEFERDLKGVGLTFIYCHLTKGIIDIICNNAHKIGSREDLLTLVPDLEEGWCEDVMRIFSEFWEDTTTL